VRRQVWLLVGATTSLVMLAFVLPLALLVERTADTAAIAAATRRGQSIAPFVATADDTAALEAARAVTGGGYSVAIFLPGDRTLATQSAGWRGGRPRGEIRTAVQRRLPDGSAVVDQPVFRTDGTAVISTRVSPSRLDRGVWHAWGVLLGLGAVLVGLSLLVADRLARSITRPAADLAAAAERLGGGDLGTSVRPEGPPEIRNVAAALNTMAQRITTLLAAEREAVADLSHRLRTPVTALRLDAETLRDPAERARLGADVDELVAQIDAVIQHARRPVSEGPAAPTDLVEVVADRMDFWKVLADEQARHATMTLPARPCLVSASRDEVCAALDALLDNVFAHTPEGTDFTVVVDPLDPGGATLTVRDTGPGFPDEHILQRGESRTGSSGLGLDIARRLAHRSGGSAEVSAEGAGAVVRLSLGGPRHDAGVPLPP
jgi:signal transduction histidine kinase